jgi:vacuolar-type H+-ATPase subunit E/Vma4
MKNWKKRLKKKRTRKAAKREINAKVEQQTNKVKRSENPYNALNTEKDRLLGAREKYVNAIIDIYKNKDSIPRCRFDKNYTDCKFLVQDEINKDILKNVKKYDDDFTYTGIGETDKYYNYYFSLLANINLSD